MAIFPLYFLMHCKYLFYICIFIACGLYWIHCYYKTRRGGWQESVWSRQNGVNKSNTGLRQQVNGSCGHNFLDFVQFYLCFIFTSVHALFSIMQTVYIFIVRKLFCRFKLWFFILYIYHCAIYLCSVWSKKIRVTFSDTHIFNLHMFNL